MRERYKHRCLWFYRAAQEGQTGMPGFKPRKARARATLFCWQTGKNIRTRECSNCTKARIVACISSVLCPHDYRQPMTSAEWDKRHKK